MKKVSVIGAPLLGAAVGFSHAQKSPQRAQPATRLIPGSDRFCPSALSHSRRKVGRVAAGV